MKSRVLIALALCSCVCLSPEQLRQLKAERQAVQEGPQEAQEAHDERVEDLAQEAERNRETAAQALQGAAPLLPSGMGALALAGAAILMGSRRRPTR
jgi:hypothetical protein